jgi:hypothetical protein
MVWLGIIGGALLAAAAGWAQGFRLERDRLVVEETHWPDWNIPAGTVQFSPAGVSPAFIQEQVNAALDAPTFVRAGGQQGGIRKAGSNLGLAALVIDGREDTFWEPAPGDSLDKWWVEIDLGRAVWAQKVVVKFVEEGKGDPLLQFKLLTSNGRLAFQQSESLEYLVAGRSEGLNKKQRLFEFKLKPTLEADPGLPGNLVRFVQIVATASDRGRAEKISQSDWENLPEADRGDIRYFRREAEGILRPVKKSEYDSILDPEERGPVEYYRREHPRLAEVEVWTAGDNISLGLLARGGKISGYGNLGAEVLAVDGDYNTSVTLQVAVSASDEGTVAEDLDRGVSLDLGTWFWVNRALLVFDRIGGSSGQEGALANYSVRTSDGSRAPDGSLNFISMNSRGQDSQEEGENNRRLAFQDNAFPLIKARYLEIAYRLLVVRWISGGIREIQLYGRGFLPQVQLTSGMIELGQAPRILSTIGWEAQAPPGTQVQIRTRTGNRLEREIHYFTKNGLEVTEAQYRKLLSFQRGDSTVTIIPGTDWSQWSQFYEAPGATISSPSPRRYLMIQATLRSDDPDRAPVLNNLHLRLGDPLASQLIGEITPQRIQQHGRQDPFALYLSPTFQPGDRGFDQVLVEFPPGVEAELVEVAVGQEKDLVAGGGRVYGPDELERVESGPDSLWIRLPSPMDQQGQETIALRFAGAFYLASNAFVASVGLGEGRDQVWQRVDAGDAASLIKGEGMTVLGVIEGGVLGEVAVAPNPFTPNGDGVNDVARFSFPVFKVQNQKAIRLEVYSLAGRLLRRVERTEEHASGLHQLSWDGRDQNGKLSPPGLYICRIGLEVDAESGVRSFVTVLVSCVY